MPRRPAQRLRAGDRVQLDVPPPRAAARPRPEPLPLDVRYEDDDLLVVNKPPGQVAHPSFRNTSGTLLNALLGRAGAGRRVAGSRTSCSGSTRARRGCCWWPSRARCRPALQRGPMVKEYLALVWGRPAPAARRIDAPLGRDPLDRRRVMASTDGAAV